MSQAPHHNIRWQQHSQPMWQHSDPFMQSTPPAPNVAPMREQQTTYPQQPVSANQQQQHTWVQAKQYQQQSVTYCMPSRPLPSSSNLHQSSVMMTAMTQNTSTNAHQAHILAVNGQAQTQATPAIDYEQLKISASQANESAVPQTAKVNYMHLLHAAPPPQTQKDMVDGMSALSVKSASSRQKVMQTSQQ